MSDLATEIQGKISELKVWAHDIWARLSAEEHNLAGKTKDLFEGLVEAETKVFQADIVPAAEKTAEDAEAAADGVVDPAPAPEAPAEAPAETETEAPAEPTA